MAAGNKRATRAKKDGEMAAMMKRLGIRRTTATCPLCYKTVRIPMDRHFYGAVCR